jgi:hypothetical protein
MASPRVVLAPVFVDRVPTVTCDADGILITNQLGDEIRSWRMSRHKALGMAAAVTAAIAKWERDEAKRSKVVAIKPDKGGEVAQG